MNPKLKKTLIITAIVLVVVDGVLLYVHYSPVWVNLSNVVALAIGVVIGWIARVLYAKYVINS